MILTKTYIKEVLAVESGLVNITTSIPSKPVNDLFICLTLANLEYIYNYLNNVLDK